MFIRALLCLLGLIAATNAAPQRDVMSTMMYLNSKMQPFGCYDVQIPYEEEIMEKCMVKLVSKLFMMDGEDKKMKMPKLPELRKMIEMMMLCNLEELDLLNGDKINKDKLAALPDHVPIEGNRADIDEIVAIFKSCVDSAIDESLTGVENALRHHQCIMKKVISNCAPTGKLGWKVPMIFAFHTIAMDNPTCTAVKVSPEIKNTYDRCVKKRDGDSTETKQMKLFMGDGTKIASEVLKGLNLILEIPELKCMEQSAEELGLMENESPNFQNISDTIASFSGWDADAKNIVVSKIKECAMEFESLDDPMRGIETGMCFLPTFAETCGLNNELSRDFLFPYIDAEFIGAIFKRIRDMFNIPQLMDNLMERM